MCSVHLVSSLSSFLATKNPVPIQVSSPFTFLTPSATTKSRKKVGIIANAIVPPTNSIILPSKKYVAWTPSYSHISTEILRYK